MGPGPRPEAGGKRSRRRSSRSSKRKRRSRQEAGPSRRLLYTREKGDPTTDQLRVRNTTLSGTEMYTALHRVFERVEANYILAVFTCHCSFGGAGVEEKLQTTHFLLKCIFEVYIESKENPKSLKKTRPCLIKDLCLFFRCLMC